MPKKKKAEKTDILACTDETSISEIEDFIIEKFGFNWEETVYIDKVTYFKDKKSMQIDVSPRNVY